MCGVHTMNTVIIVAVDRHYRGVTMAEPAQEDLENVLEEVAFLARSVNRVQLLKELYYRGELQKDDLRRECDASRTTLQRNLRALEENGWIEQSNQSCVLTAKGETATEQFFNLIDDLHAIRRLAPVLEHIGSTEIDFDPQSLADGEIFVANPHDPYGPTDGVLAAVNTANTIRVMLPAVAPYGAETVCQRITNSNVDIEILVDEETGDVLFSDSTYKPYMEEMLSTGRCTVFAVEDPITYYIGLFDDIVTQFGVLDQDGVPYALVETRSTDARRSGETVYNQYKQQARPLATGAE